MPETPEAFWERAHGALTPRALEPPLEQELARHGVGGVDCRRCARDPAGALWSDDNWRVVSLPQPSGLPVVVILETRSHFEFHDLPAELQAELGPLLVRVQRAVYAVGDIGNVHVCRWGDGSEHFHFWFMARPARVPQLVGSFVAIWDDILPPLPDELWRANLAVVADALASPS